MWGEMQAHLFESSVAVQDAMALLDAASEPERCVQEPHLDWNPDYTVRNRMTEASVQLGQTFLRRCVLSAYRYRCCITGLAIPSLLVASHSVPWRADEMNRMNPGSGLCLSALHDKAFDAGVISLIEDLTIRVSRKQRPSDPLLFEHHFGVRGPKHHSPRQVSSPS